MNIEIQNNVGPTTRR